MAIAENNLISSTAAYAKDRAALEQLLSITLDRYGISLKAAASGTIEQAPVIPNLTAPAPPPSPKPLSRNLPPAPRPDGASEVSKLADWSTVEKLSLLDELRLQAGLENRVWGRDQGARKRLIGRI